MMNINHTSPVALFLVGRSIFVIRQLYDTRNLHVTLRSSDIFLTARVIVSKLPPLPCFDYFQYEGFREQLEKEKMLLIRIYAIPIHVCNLPLLMFSIQVVNQLTFSASTIMCNILSSDDQYHFYKDNIYAPASIDRGHIVFGRSICPSAKTFTLAVAFEW